MSLLIEAGHSNAADMPLGWVKAEALIVSNRENARVRTEAVLTYQAVSAVVSPMLSGKPDATKAFNETLKRLQDNG